MLIYRADTVVVERDADGSVFLKVDVPGKVVNVFDRQVLFDLDVAFDRVLAEGRVPLLIIRSGKPSGFVAGADVRQFADIMDATGAEALSKTGQDLFNKLANLPMPTAAMIHGPCLGGGLEFALACDYRLVYDKANTQFGLPEVELGLLPGWGGTQRLPRVVGLERALQMILSGKRLNAREAYRWRLADAYAADEAGLREQLAGLTARALAGGKRQPKRLPLRTWRQKLLESTAAGRRLLFRGAERVLRRRVPDDMPAPGEALAAVRTGLIEGIGAGLARERSAAGRLATGPACRNLVGLFFAREKARKLPEGLRADASHAVRRVGVVGAGVMGAGIAQLAALKGYEVVVQEVNEAALGAGMVRITNLFHKAAERGIVPVAEAERRLSAVTGTVKWEGFGDVDVVVEAAVEDLEAKRAVFQELEARTLPGTVLATNTSSLPVTQLQTGLAHPGRIAGLHFFNPVHKLPLVEVARAAMTEDATVAFLLQWAAALGKTPVVVKDSPGFVVNRVLMPYLNEAVLLVAEGSRVEDVDSVMRRFGMPVGPLELLDQIGLDVAAHVAKSTRPALDGRFPPNDAFERMCSNGWLGSKGGRGFYDYRAGKKTRANRLAQNLLRGEAGPADGLVRALPPAARQVEARERMVLLMVNEAARGLADGLAADAETIDLAMVMGSGWAPHRGGPLHYADFRGLPDVVGKLTEFAGRYGARFEPAAELRRRAESGQPFTRPVGATSGTG